MDPAVTFTLGKFDKASGSIPVTFTDPATGQTHARSVNAVLTARGSLDRAATRARIEQVAAGVSHKFKLGLLAGQGD